MLVLQKSEKLPSEPDMRYGEQGSLKYRRLIRPTSCVVRDVSQSSEQLFLAWSKYPQYENFIRMELDKVWDYVYTCVSKRPYFVEPLDPLNVLRGSMSYEQRMRKAEYQHQLSRWIQSPGR